jgi:CheY-like chemotaxis protein
MGELIRRVLVAEHHTVDLAPDGVSALGLAAGEAYDVLVLDRMLPDLEGLELLRLLPAHYQQLIEGFVLSREFIGRADDLLLPSLQHFVSHTGIRLVFPAPMVSY